MPSEIGGNLLAKFSDPDSDLLTTEKYFRHGWNFSIEQKKAFSTQHSARETKSIYRRGRKGRRGIAKSVVNVFAVPIYVFLPLKIFFWLNAEC
ncbi:MAG TPA: hypothetical protein VG488_06555 [Candidatus Angelobacter sp.]|nr:hypothetical protein [Candidatus Angelobacter sp.]